MTDVDVVEDANVPEIPELNGLVEAYVAARGRREDASATEKRLREVESRAELALFDELERQNLRSVRHATLGLFYLNDQVSATVTDDVALRSWAVEVMPELLIANRARLGSVVRHTLKEGGELPPGTDYSTYRKIGWRDRPGGKGGEE